MPLFMGNTGQLGVPNAARALPIVRTFSPTVVGGNFIAGITYNSSGSVLPNCIVQLFRTADDSYVAQTTSDASTGYFYLPASDLFSHYLVAYLAGSPDVAGTTINTLLGGFTSAGAVSYSAEAQQFFSRLVTQPSTARKALYATMINSLVSASVWTKLDGLYLFAAADAATALTNLVQTTYAGTAVNSPTFTADQGYTGAATKYISPSFNPSTATTPNYVRDSASIFAWSLTSGQIAGNTVGSLVSAFQAFEIIPRFTDDGWYGGINSTAQQSVATGVTDGSGLRTTTRTVSTEFKNYTAASLTSTSTDNSVAVVNDSMVFISDPGQSRPYTGVTACAGFGSGFTAQNVTDLYNALHTYLQTVAGVT